MKKKLVLVTGGAGFIGSHVNKLLYVKGYRTVVFDNLSRGDPRAVVNGEFIEGDLGNESDLEKLFSTNQFDAVMHFAAYIDVGESVSDPEKYYTNNVVNTLKLLHMMRKYQVKNIIFSSTAALFGIPQTPKISEDHPLSPLNPYGETKWIIEKALRDYGNAYNIKWCNLRYFNAAGGDPGGEVKNFKKKESNLIPIILRNIANGLSEVQVFGTDYNTHDGTCIRDYIHVWDLAEAHIAALERLLRGGTSTAYNLGNGQGFSVREVIRTAEQVTEIKVNIVEAGRRQGDSPILIADSTKAIEELKWKPKYPDLETIIRHAWNALVKIPFTEYN